MNSAAELIAEDLKNDPDLAKAFVEYVKMLEKSSLTYDLKCVRVIL